MEYTSPGFRPSRAHHSPAHNEDVARELNELTRVLEETNRPQNPLFAGDNARMIAESQARRARRQPGAKDKKVPVLQANDSFEKASAPRQVGTFAPVQFEEALKGPGTEAEQRSTQAQEEDGKGSAEATRGGFGKRLGKLIGKKK